MSNTSDHDLIVEMHADMKTVKGFMEEVKAGSIGPCQRHEEAIGELKKNVKSLWSRVWQVGLLATGLGGTLGAIAAALKH